MNESRCRKIRLVAILLALTAILVFTDLGQTAPPGQQGPPPKVGLTTVETRDIVPATEYVGHVEAIQAVDIRARVEGFIDEIKFTEGDMVKAGTVLYVLEQDQYQARLEAEDAIVKQDEAELTRAQQQLARLEAARPESISASDLDNARAAVATAKGKLAESKANLTQARLNLDYATIEAPITGRIGRTAFTRGNLVSPSSGPLARIVQISPIRVVYSISENDIPAIQAAMADAGKEDGSRLLSPQLRLADSSAYGETGAVDFVDNQVDPTTGTVAVRASFPNKGGQLLPGQYVTVLVKKSEPVVMPVVPQAAVLSSQEGRSVMVVDSENKATPRPITIGPTVGGTMWAVESGLKGGEKIIVQGIQKVRPGMVVQPAEAGQEN